MTVKIKGALELSPNGLRVLEKRYLRRNIDGEIIETPEEMFRRVANIVAQGELNYDPSLGTEDVADEFFQVMADLEFLPNSPTLLNAGTGSGQLASCFVLPVDDSVEATFDTVKHTALIHKSGGGIGFNFSNIRPKHDRVGDRHGVSAGPVALIEVIAKAADYILQGGVRRGCNSVVLSVNHPDILDFIRSKSNPADLTNFYISVVVTDDFMSRVAEDLTFPLINPRNGECIISLSAKSVFDQLVDQAWHTGDPGLVFTDRINQDNPTPDLGKIENITGCGEQALLPYEACPLGSINLSRMLTKDIDGIRVNYRKIARIVRIGVRFLDNLVDINHYPLDIVDRASKLTRKIGLGVMGFADMLFQMGIPYNTKEAVEIAEDIMGFINSKAHEASQALAIERGAFPAYPGSRHEKKGVGPIRNAACTCVAPTGTLSIVAGCSCGIEPLFSVAFIRRMLDGETLLEINPHFEKAVGDAGVWTKELARQLICSNHLHEQEAVPEDIRRVFVTAHQVSPEWHVRIQSAFQKHVDAAVSKTVNFPHRASREDIARVFKLAHQSGLKGITVYRDGSREEQPQGTGEEGIALVDQYFLDAA